MKCPNHHIVPDHATFCPTCGARAVTLINAQLFADLEERAELDLDDLPTAVERPRWPWLVAGAALLMGAAAAVMVLASAPEASPGSAEPALVNHATATPPTSASVAHAPVFQTDDLRVDAHPAVHTLRYKEMPLIDLRTTRGSRYATLDERSAAAALRIKHAWTTSANAGQSATFTARAHGDIHEVVWTRPGESDFLVVEVTDHDVRAWEKLNGKTTRSILANLLADRLSALTVAAPNA
jgi:hypothetical protein